MRVREIPVHSSLVSVHVNESLCVLCHWVACAGVGSAAGAWERE